MDQIFVYAFVIGNRRNEKKVNVFKVKDLESMDMTSKLKKKN
jgi:hypothetical protein